MIPYTTITTTVINIYKNINSSIEIVWEVEWYRIPPICFCIETLDSCF